MIKMIISRVAFFLLFSVLLFFSVLAIKKPLEKVHAQTLTIIAKDIFQRPNQTSWGKASDGQIWGGDANTGIDFSMNNNTGQVASDKVGQTGLLGPTVTDAQTLVTF